MNKTTRVTHVGTNDQQTFYNSQDLKTNLVTAIIYSTEDRRKILEHAYRDKIEHEAKIDIIRSLDGRIKAYSQAFDMIATYE